MNIEYFDNPPRTMPSGRDAVVIKLRVELIEAQARIAKLEIEAHERNAELATWRGVALRGRDEWVKAQEYQRHLVAELESRDKEIAELQMNDIGIPGLDDLYPTVEPLHPDVANSHVPF